MALLCSIVAIGQQPSLTLNGRVRIEGGAVDGTNVVVYKNGQKQRIINKGLNKFNLELELNANYILSFEKEGFVTKKLSFNTRVPAEAAANGFTAFDFSVSLFKQYEGVNTVVFNQPVGMIRYDRNMDDFDYDTDYTRSIQSAMDETLAAVKEKQDEERSGSTQKKAAEEAKVRQREEAAAQKAAKEEQAKQEAERKKAEELAARQKREEVKPPPVPEVKPPPPPPPPSPVAEKKPPPPPPAPKKTPPPPPAPRPVVKTEPKPPAQAVARTVTRTVPATAVTGETSRRTTEPVVAQEPRPKYEPTPVEIVRHEEIMADKNQVVTLIRLDDGNTVTEYRKVVRRYGAVFYFRNNVSVTQVVYDQGVGNVATAQ